MAESEEGPSIWAQYNAKQNEREVRPLCREVIELAGPGAGRTAVDLGCGLGRETDALLRAGWRVHAVDWEPGTPANLAATIRPEDRERLTVQTSGFAELAELAAPDAVAALPESDLVYAGYSVPYIAPTAFAGFWQLVRSVLRPGGWCALNLFGDHDSYAEEHADEWTFLAEPEARALFDGWELVKFEVEDRDGASFGGPKHWHLFNVVARRPFE